MRASTFDQLAVISMTTERTRQSVPLSLPFSALARVSMSLGAVPASAYGTRPGPGPPAVDVDMNVSSLTQLLPRTPQWASRRHAHPMNARSGLACAYLGAGEARFSQKKKI